MVSEIKKEINSFFLAPSMCIIQIHMHQIMHNHTLVQIRVRTEFIHMYEPFSGELLKRRTFMSKIQDAASSKVTTIHIHIGRYQCHKYTCADIKNTQA